MKRFMVLAALLVVLVAAVAVASMSRLLRRTPARRDSPIRVANRSFLRERSHLKASTRWASIMPPPSTLAASRRTRSVSQYDVACFQNGSH